MNQRNYLNCNPRLVPATIGIHEGSLGGGGGHTLQASRG